MKDMSKNKLAISRLNDGSFEIEYNIDNNINNSFYDNAVLVNIMTKEKFFFKDLILRVDGNDIYLYPERSRANRKKEKNFELINWIFEDDSRINKVMAAAEAAEKDGILPKFDRASRWTKTSNFFTREGEVKPTLSIFTKEKEEITNTKKLSGIIVDLITLGGDVAKALEKISDVAGETKYDLKKNLDKIQKDLIDLGIKLK